MNYRDTRDLIEDTDGVAMIEFAFIAPVLLVMILGGLELTNFALSYMRVNQIAMTVADNAGRIPTSVDEANIYEVFAGADVLGEDLDFEANGRVVLSSLQDNKGNGVNKGQMIHWQRCWGDLTIAPAYGREGKGRSDNSLNTGMGQGSNKITAAQNTAVMFVEVTYDYQPLVGPNWMAARRIRHESAFNVRGRQNQDIGNAQGLAVNACT
ncbi:TadE/TadG family type IV pilus assembly protein [Qipengyuania vesicularis]|uniref:TadE/TadG family type IV pilus assembly protein n=1 Tax=Qipengyuania vesicularis TaxID=2867232 RepID=UPI001FFD696B|nr:TadE/TadG family type IV pilus assembly protein [Qipengyuania vesicularis]